MSRSCRSLPVHKQPLFLGHTLIDHGPPQQIRKRAGRPGGWADPASINAPKASCSRGLTARPIGTRCGPSSADRTVSAPVYACVADFFEFRTSPGRGRHHGAGPGQPSRKWRKKTDRLTASIACDQPRPSPKGACRVAERRFRTPLAQRGIFGEPQRRRLVTRRSFAIRSLTGMREASGAAKSATLMDRREARCEGSRLRTARLGADCWPRRASPKTCPTADRGARKDLGALGRAPCIRQARAGRHSRLRSLAVTSASTSARARPATTRWAATRQTRSASCGWKRRIALHEACRSVALIGKPVMMKGLAGIQLSSSEA
jgi:hypothetical protein